MLAPILYINVALGIVFAEGLLRGSRTDIGHTNNMDTEVGSKSSLEKFLSDVGPRIDALLNEGTEAGRRAGTEACPKRASETTASDDLVAVVSNFHNKSNLNWIESTGVGLCVTGYDSPRNISESLPQLAWIEAHYNNLPKGMLFLHGDQHSWHLQDFPMAIFSTNDHDVSRPFVRMLADPTCVWTTSLPDRLGKELPHLNRICNALFGRSFPEMFKSYNMGMNFRCCSERLMNREAAQKLTRPTYKALIELIKEEPDKPWAWVFERLWQLMSSPDVPILPEEQVLRALKGSHNDTASVLEMLARDMTARDVTEIIEVARSSCTDPMSHGTMYGTES